MTDLTDEEDVEVLMHRNAHFGGSFAVMADYYEKEGKGAILDPRRVRRLAALEKQSGQDLAPHLLTEPDFAAIDKSLKTYHTLREIYEISEQQNPNPRLLSDLIISESEEEKSAIAAVVARGSEILPDLIQLLRSPDFADPLFPGYGSAPALAAQCLGLIGDPSAIPPLFETLGSPDTDLDEAAAKALGKIGEPARAFCLKLLSASPITGDTENAAFALSLFPPDPVISRAAFKLLEMPTIRTNQNLALYLVFCCTALEGPDRTALSLLAELSDTPQSVRDEITYLLTH